MCEFDKKINIRLRNVLYIFIIYFYFILYVKITFPKFGNGERRIEESFVLNLDPSSNLSI